ISHILFQNRYESRLPKTDDIIAQNHHRRHEASYLTLSAITPAHLKYRQHPVIRHWVFLLRPIVATLFARHTGHEQMIDLPAGMAAAGSDYQATLRHSLKITQHPMRQCWWLLRHHARPQQL